MKNNKDRRIILLVKITINHQQEDHTILVKKQEIGGTEKKIQKLTHTNTHMAFLFSALGKKPMALHILGNHSTTKLGPLVKLITFDKGTK